ncbi:MAG: NAD-dependent epimerase [Acidimicrobiaceae bacterium]|jgi:dihydroflavonol-4-reductase|nr:NAD-dependent epimerase [Acidimicrobiaceae bacterium]|tara:strand:+ start:1207 stop:2175 length:969 start_codon:yes stop_codon:yes gene_type:complete
MVTGVTGYIGQHCGAELLRQGYEVIGTMRSKEKAEAVREGIAKVAPIDKLTFVEADLTSDENWSEAMAGCKYVLHVASPFIIGDPEDENEMISPAVDGTLRVLSAAKAVGVERTVVTSSLVAIIAGKLSGHYGTDSWSDPDEEIGTYARSKTLAEQAAWEFAKANDIDLVVINPGGVMGPTLTGRVEGFSLTMISDIITGKYPLVPNICIGFIDVRDVAKLHVAAMTAQGAVGKRFIASSDEPLHFKEVTGILKNAGYKKASTRQAPKFLLKVMSLFDDQVKGLLPMVGERQTVANQETYEILGWEPTPMNQSLIETAESIS